MSGFLSDDFLLQNEAARVLYHEYAAKMPIYDYHCHLPVAQIAADHNFENLTQIWLAGDHYKWRAMRANGVPEEYITGGVSDYEKFEKWAQTVPYTLRNPLYHWTHLELKRYFGVEKLLSAETAIEIYSVCSEMLCRGEFSVRNLLRKMNVKLCCTTEEPLDSLEHHRKLKDEGFEIRVVPAWRPDAAMAVDKAEKLNRWVDKLAELTGCRIDSYDSYLEAISKRHEFFHEMGCRLSDHGLETMPAEEYTAVGVDSIFKKIRARRQLDPGEQAKFKSAMLVDLAVMDWEKGWVQQFHLGALRNTNTKMFQQVGADAGFDSIGDFEIARPLARFLDLLNSRGKLAKTILYNLNPRDNELIATMIGNFQDGSSAGKMQYGPAWWFLDQKDGIERQINVISNMGLLSRFVGMTTDSRSFMSYPRHEYFRRVLCNMLGGEMERGELPDDFEMIGRMVEDICFNNAARYFGIELD